MGQHAWLATWAAPGCRVAAAGSSGLLEPTCWPAAAIQAPAAVPAVRLLREVDAAAPLAAG